MKSRTSDLKANIAQIDKFREAAPELDTDDSEENFDRVLKRVAKAQAPKADEKPKKSK